MLRQKRSSVLQGAVPVEICRMLNTLLTAQVHNFMACVVTQTCNSAVYLFKCFFSSEMFLSQLSERRIVGIHAIAGLRKKKKKTYSNTKRCT